MKTTHTMLRMLLILGALMGPAGTAPADELVVGQYANHVYDGYTWYDGYWWKGDVPYNAYRTRVVAYDKYNCPYYSWSYSYKAVDYKKKPTYTIDLDKNDALQQVLKIAEDRNNHEMAIRAKAAKFNEVKEAIVLLGMDGNFRIKGFGQEVNYAKGFDVGYSKETYSQLTQQQGSTQYGVSGFREETSSYGSTDIGAIYREALRARQESRSYEAQGDQATTALVDNLGKRAAIIEEIRTRGIAAARTFAATAPSPQTHTTREYFSAGGSTATAEQPRTSPPPVDPPPAAADSDLIRAAQAVFDAKCLSCHNEKKPNGKLDVTDMKLLSGDQLGKIKERILDTDPQTRMPLKADLKPGTPLSADEVDDILSAIRNLRGQK